MIHYTIGIDEAGRGAWAGPVFAGAFAVLHSKFKKSSLWKLLADSKTLAEKQRNSIFTYIVAAFDTGDIAYGVGMSSASEIDSLGIKKANHLAMKRALTEILAHIPLEAHMVVQVDGRDHYTFDDILSHRSYEVHEYVR